MLNTSHRRKVECSSFDQLYVAFMEIHEIECVFSVIPIRRKRCIFEVYFYKTKLRVCLFVIDILKFQLTYWQMIQDYSSGETYIYNVVYFRTDICAAATRYKLTFSFLLIETICSEIKIYVMKLRLILCSNRSAHLPLIPFFCYIICRTAMIVVMDYDFRRCSCNPK